jgi:hypothetical protein
LKNNNLAAMLVPNSMKDNEIRSEIPSTWPLCKLLQVKNIEVEHHLRNRPFVLEVTIARVLPHSQGIKGSMCMQFAE